MSYDFMGQFQLEKIATTLGKLVHPDDTIVALYPTAPFGPGRFIALTADGRLWEITFRTETREGSVETYHAAILTPIRVIVEQ